MHQLTINLIVVAVGAIGVLGHPGAAGTAPAVHFWEAALPCTPVPEVIADLVQKVVPPILPRDVAQKVPFSDPESVLATFHIAPSSAEAATVRATLSQCQALPVDPEQKACATSLEGTVQSAMYMLGKDDNGALWAAASALPSTGLPLQSYMIQAVTPLDGDSHVGCHVMPYPYAVYYCHMTGQPTKAYLVSLHSVSGGPAVTLAALCHLDTSNWDPAHPAFEMLHTQPGGVPICHFMPYANLLFGEKAVAGNP